MSEKQVDENTERYTYKVTPASDDGRVIRVTVNSGLFEGKSALIATFSSEEAYYNQPEYKALRGKK